MGACQPALQSIVFMPLPTAVLGITTRAPVPLPGYRRISTLWSAPADAEIRWPVSDGASPTTREVSEIMRSELPTLVNVCAVNEFQPCHS